MQTDDELQGVTVDAGEEQAQTTDTQTPEKEADLATAQEPEPDQKPEGDGQVPKDGVQEAINRQHRRFRDEQRAHAQTQEELDRLKAELEQAKGPNVEPAIPPMPDPDEEGFEAKMAERDAAIEARSAWRERQQLLSQQAQEQQRQAQNAAIERRAEMADTYAGRVKELQLDGSAMQQAAEVVASYRLSDDIVDLILTDEDGPLITQYLAQDVLVLDSLSRMNPVEAGRTIERDIRAKAQALRPKTSDAPPPPETLTGGGPGDDVLGGHKVTIE